MNSNFVKEKLRSRRPVLGTWSILNDPWAKEIFACSGLDFQILDMEHGVFDLPTLGTSILACESRGCSPLVRVPDTLGSHIQSALDLGAHGVVVPQVQGFASANEAVRSTLFAPKGTRGFNPFTRAGDYSGQKTARLNDEFVFSSIIVENRKSYEDLDQILTIEALDMIYLGVYDMSAAFGCIGEMKNPAVLSFLETSIPKIRKAGKAAGLMVKTKEEMERYLGMGANFLVFAVDTFIIRNAVQNFVSDFKRLI